MEWKNIFVFVLFIVYCVCTLDVDIFFFFGSFISIRIPDLMITVDLMISPWIAETIILWVLWIGNDLSNLLIYDRLIFSEEYS